ncbi:SIR2-like domain-containing protein [Daldinia grandis]|nr:SIR2-like domain-containing protein [Daldinia grandis]
MTTPGQRAGPESVGPSAPQQQPIETPAAPSPGPGPTHTPAPAPAPQPSPQPGQNTNVADPDKLDREKGANRRQTEAIHKLRRELKAGRLVICVGSGVTLHADPSAERRRMGWGGLVENGLQYVEDQTQQITDRHRHDIDRARELLGLPDWTMQDQFEAISRLEGLFTKRPDLFAGWLKHQFDSLYDTTVDRNILDSLRRLHRHGAMLITTNYDDLLEKHCGIPPIGRSDEYELLSFQRKSFDGVFHPHGHWKDPENIILSARNYQDVIQDESVQDALVNIISTRTILFVGAGGGLDDPNWGQLLRWVGEKYENKGPVHYVLLPKSVGNEIPHLPLNHLTCKTRDDISLWLENLLEPGGGREGTVHENLENIERMDIHRWLSPLDQAQFLNDHSDIQDKITPFHQSVTNIPNFWETDNPSFVWLTGNGGFGKTVFCTSVIDSTRQNCRLGTAGRSRDSLAYFFCATHDLFEQDPTPAHHDFSTFCRTVINQLCPPRAVYTALRELYTTCTEYHPPRHPTNLELRDVLLRIISDLSRERLSTPNEPIEPGETYLVIDGLDHLPKNRQSPYLELIKEIRARKFQHFHLLISSRDTPRIRNPIRYWGEWNEISCNPSTVGPSIRGYVTRCIYNDPQFHDLSRPAREPLALWLIDTIANSGQSFWWVYWKLQELKDLDFFDRTSIEGVLYDDDGVSEEPEGPPARKRRTTR